MLIITRILLLVMICYLRNKRGSMTIIIAAYVTTLLFFPLLASMNNNNITLKAEPAFAQGQGLGIMNTTMANDTTTPESSNFLPYQDPIHGIFITYPSDWIASTSGLRDYTDVIAFYSPFQNLSDSFSAGLRISVTPYSQNITLPEYTNHIWTILNQSQQQVDVKNSSEVTVAGHPGFRVVLADRPSENNTFISEQMNTWTVIGNTVYFLTYEGEQSVFNQHLPEVSRMLESLVIGTNTNNSNNNNSTSTSTTGNTAGG
jgi:hypothetical protein